MSDIDTLIAELRAGLDAEMDWRKSQADFGQLARFIHAASPQNIRALLDHIEGLTDPRQIVGGGYVQLSDYDAMQARAEAAEAELARLRAPVTDGEVRDCLAKLNNRKVNEPDFGMRLRHETADLLTRLAKERDECLNASADYLIDLTDVKARADRLAGLVKEATARVRDIENIALTSVGPGYRAIHQIVGGLLENLKEPTNE